MDTPATLASSLPFVLLIPTRGEPLQVPFGSYEDLRKWCDEQVSVWSWVAAGEVGPQYGQQLQEARSIFQAMVRARDTLADAIAKRATTNAVPEAQFDAARTLITNSTKIPGFFCTQQPEGAMLKQLANFPYAAAAAWLVLIGRHQWTPQLAMAQGVCAATYLLEATSGTDRYRDSLNSTIARFAADLSKGTQDQIRLVDSLQSLQDRLAAASQDFSVRTDAQLDSSEKRLAALLATAESSLRALERTYDSGLSLKAPVTYWRKKRTRHLWLSVLFGGIMGAFFAVLGYELRDISSLLVPHGTEPTTIQNLSVENVLYVLTVLTLVFWCGRILVRLFLGQVHLAIDAGHRAIMAETYLSLLRDGGAAPEDKAIVLTSLFRPVSTGIVRDDALPPTLPATLAGGITR